MASIAPIKIRNMLGNTSDFRLYTEAFSFSSKQRLQLVLKNHITKIDIFLKTNNKPASNEL